ncbi:uncharacterized mitochondrial protein AtMg00810-like [Nicotiana tomentosiformis]|uniref:uncharacterized mitochondrial protein AtMg00810-like n=1 Tax=Nicotiana tomentosiformis TaxID=4098 RepID=UPI0008782372|nr:uncharacterized mitochondrial protein AtMg00810-like [Nicotiana tomentosiformis]
MKAFFSSCLHSNHYYSPIPTHVCKLHKSFYGLKQAPRAWYNKLHQFLISVSFTTSKTNVSLFIYSYNNVVIYLLVYVDDIVLIENCSSFIDSFVQALGRAFSIRDLGPLHYFLGIQVNHNSDGIWLSQSQYIESILTKVGMIHCKPLSSPMATNAKLHKGDTPDFDDPSLYRQVVGALQCLILTKRDISFVVNKVCQFMHNPSFNQWAAVKRILRYLQHTKSMSFLFSKASNLYLQAFTDSDWASSIDDRKSIGGYAIYFGPNLISWSSRKQRTVARSSTESE